MSNNDVRALIRQAVASGHDPEDVTWAVIEGCSTVIDGLTGGSAAGITTSSLSLLVDCLKHRAGNELTPNPWFVFNGHDDNPSPYSTKYLRNRGRKGLAGSALAIGGALGSSVTQVDVVGIAQNANATGSTAAHLYKLRGLAGNYKQSQTLTGWIDLLIKMKAFKAGIRGGQLAGAAIPVGAVGMATGLAASAVKLGVKLKYTNSCLITAADIHWRAYQEQAISGGLFGRRGQIGPASNMLYEIFARRGATRIFGKYDVDKIIREPAGWMAVSDKLLLI